MKITLYRMLQDEDRKLLLKDEKDFNYTNEDGLLNNPHKIAEMMNTLFDLDKQAEEYVYMLAMSANMQVQGVFEISHGSLNYSLIDVRDFFRKALLCNSTSVICVHNHPTGDTKPSREDKVVTDKLRVAGDMIGIKLIDHIIVGGKNAFSFNSEGMLEPWKD